MGRLIVNLPLVGQSISRVAFDYAVTLLTDGGAELRIETAFSIATREEAAAVVEPSVATEQASALVRLIGCEVELADAGSDGSLRLAFSGGRTIEVLPHPEFEAWTFAGADGAKAVSVPGGSLTTWGLD
jgi:Family of unknown function (DUF6188)